MDLETIHSLIGDIYNAALEPDRWESVVLNMGDAFQATTGVLAMYDIENPHKDVLRVTRFDPDIFSHYLTNFFQHKDIWYRLTLEHCTTGDVFVGSDLITDRELRKIPMYHEVLAPTGGGQLLGCLLNDSQEQPAAVTFSRPLGAPEFDVGNKRAVEILARHLCQAYRIHTSLNHYREAESRAQRALYESSVALLLLDTDGRIVFASREAESVLMMGDGIRSIGRRLLLDDSRQSDRLGSLVAQAADTSRGDGLDAGGGMRVSRPSGAVPLEVVVTPINLHSEYEILSADAAVCVLVQDPAKNRLLPNAILHDLFHLTRSEIKVAQLLFDGHTTHEIGTLLDIKMPTVRTHLRRIFEKTDTRNQSELVRRLALGPWAL